MATSPSGPEAKRSAWLTPTVISAVVLTALALIFVFTNLGTARVQLLFWTVNSPLWVVILVALVVGVIIGSLFPWLKSRKKG
ncbi:putative integral membrane protein [Psychromicrobium silvestre]|uniref:Putative integral membrane protein n=1 Tax=Psychromicrobium silvestre TaxID=1645614 RepID=A0A7Y9S579_9MICC|nr:LapA family protein [Psychromicrobium silvestre]NYE93891.1 putative integral membrane protein [Psychromicrobium silvestre]